LRATTGLTMAADSLGTGTSTGGAIAWGLRAIKRELADGVGGAVGIGPVRLRLAARPNRPM